METKHHFDGTEIAIIGMAGRFPGANNIETFWRNLHNGTESITFLTTHDLEALGVEPMLRERADYVKAASLLEGIEQFDASFFGYTAREAALMDPQQRILLECAWEALEHAGYDSNRYPGLIGVYAGATLNSYLLLNLAPRYGRERRNTLEDVQLSMGNAADFLTTRISYKLNLTGPSHTIQTACSTSLVAVHVACQNLLHGECDMALAGGISINLTHRTGYLYQKEGIVSPDGHCRAFDARAQGTIFGSGVGLVVLKRLEEALHDGDYIHAIIRGSAINNDGAFKAGYTAPSVEGQARVIAEALANAEVDAETIRYIEAHGTGTALGDPIEMQALTKAFREFTEEKHFCAIGSVKTNIGHLDVAAGVAGLMKTVLMLKHRQIPSSLHFQQANSEIDFTGSPFYVNTQLTAWKPEAFPRRAGVSSFGIGGTNAHVIVEEAPPMQPGSSSRPWQLLLLSAKTSSALDEATARLTEHLKCQPDSNIADVAYTGQVGRREFAHRRMIVCREREEAIGLLEQREPERVLTQVQQASERPVVFLFPGQGSQYVNMGRQLYESEPVYRAALEEAASLVAPQLGCDIRALLYPSPEQAEAASQHLQEATFAQPALFVVEYALARLWQGWGVQPQAMLGHSLGEYVAACLAGVFTLAEAIRLVVLRGRLMQEMAAGAMLAVALPERQVRARLGSERVALAAVNGRSACVVAGPSDEVAALRQQWEQEQVLCREVMASHAYHTAMMEPLRERLVATMRQVRLQPPRVPYLSNVTGDWIRAEEATDPQYWGRHVCEPVRFADGLDRLAEQSERVFLEVGPSYVLSRFVRSHLSPDTMKVIPSLRHPKDVREDEYCLLEALGKLWLNGVKVQWDGFYAHEQRKRLPLPTYPFERQRYWIEPPPFPLEEHSKSIPVSHNGDVHSMTVMKKDVSGSELVPSIAIPVMPTASRQEEILARLKKIVGNLLGESAEKLNSDTNFFQLGLDSLILIQANHAIKNDFGVEVSLRQLFEELSSLRTLAEYIDQHQPSVECTQTDMSAQLSTISETALFPDVPAMDAATTPATTSTTSPVSAVPAPMENLFTQQLQLLSRQMEIQHTILARQLELLRPGQLSATTPVLPADFSSQAQSVTKRQEESRIHLSGGAGRSVNGTQPPVFVAYQPLRTQAEEINSRQRQALDALLARYTTRTRKSRQRVQESRFVRANHRNSMAFRLLWKEMVYPVIASRSRGAHIWDIDGNEYVDVTMGFGVTLFGHSAPFIMEALSKALQQGILIGPLSEKAERVAQLIAELTGVERVAFYNSGTEAVMVALRLARAATGRTKIAIFAGAFHGTFDGVQARSGLTAEEEISVPLAPGIPPDMVKDVLVLNYGTAQALEVIKAHAHELAAVLVEPVQSRRPDLQPGAFLKQLRQVTADAGAILIFDEIITGFRVHPGGAQASFDVQADLVTYGKVIGGGMPIGVVAGKAAVMDCIDGGMWNYGDTSYPPHDAGRTIVGGTFCEHPLAMAAAEAVLEHLKEQGPELQQQLNERTAYLAETLNTYFLREQMPVRVACFGSLFRFLFQGDFDLLYYYLLDKGIYIWEGRTCFLSTAHTEQDIEYIIQSVKDSIEEMRAGGFLPPSPLKLTQVDQAGTEGKFPLSFAQQRLWYVDQLGADSTYNIFSAIRMVGMLDIESLQCSLNEIVRRHEVLRSVFTEADGQPFQVIQEPEPVSLRLVDLQQLTGHEQDRRVQEILQAETQQPFDLAQGPLLRATLLQLTPTQHVIVLVIHHIVFDGWSLNIFLREMTMLYQSFVAGHRALLPELSIQYRDYAQWQRPWLRGQHYEQQLSYWKKQLGPHLPVLELPSDKPRPAIQTYRGATHRFQLPRELAQALRHLSQQEHVTLFMLLLAAFQALLHLYSGQDDIVVGTPSANRQRMEVEHLLGFFVNMLVMRVDLSNHPSFRELLGRVRETVLEAYAHQDMPFEKLVEELKVERDPGRSPLFQVMFLLDTLPQQMECAGVRLSPIPLDNATSKFDLSLMMYDTGEDLSGEFEYNTDLFELDTITRMAAHLQTFLESVVEQPDATI